MESQEFSEKQADFFGKFGAAIFPIIVQEAHNSVMISDDKGIICWVNSSFTRITGYLPEEAIGKTPAFLRAPGKHSDGFYKNLWQRVVETSQWKGEIWSVNKDGLIYPGDVFLKAILDPVEKTIKFTFAVMRDLSEQKRAEDKLRRIALHDALTDLPNRLYFTEKLKESLIEARRNGSRVALFYIDLDEFKLINDNHSHECGDFILHEFAKRLQGCLHDIDFIARLGSDEFVVISKNIADSQQASLIAEKIISAMKPIAIFECKEIRVAVEIKLSIGIAIFPDDARTEKDLISYSSKAMYKSKSDCREAGSACHGAYQFYNPQMCADVLQREMLRIAMLKALDADEFTLMYQPQVATDGRLYGLEALIRWYSPELGQVSPGYFIPAAELMRLIIPIGTWVLNEACRQIRLWCNMGLRKKVSVNVSGKQFNDPNFVDIVYLVLGRHGIDPDLLVLE
ncbi:MAG: diguanylate cyclase, partial [Candidatus Falkowbacteria bacterium]|nr:diguanylate cyclase [Candidatus Falkowbacteria bacterium]